MKPRKFSLGHIVATPGALELLDRTHTHALALLARHVEGDWGELCPRDQQANERSLEDGTRILSNYPLTEGRLWIITEADRSLTTLLLPEEY